MNVTELVVAFGRLTPLERYAFVRLLIEHGLARHAAALPDRSSCVEFAPDFFGPYCQSNTGTGLAPDPELAPDSFSGSLSLRESSFGRDLEWGVRGENQEKPFLKKINALGHTVDSSLPSVADLVQLWNATVVRLPKVHALTADRRRRGRARLQDWPTLDWAAAIRRLDASPFCTGVNHLGWRADFDFFLRPMTIPRLLEGIYDRRPSVPSSTGRTAPSVASTRDYLDRLFGSRSSKE